MPLLALGQLAVGRPLDAIETRTLATWDPVEIEPKQHLIDIGAVYRFIAKDYDAGHNRQRARHFAAFLDTHADGSVGSVLDLCCGTGLLGPTLRRRARHLTGIDLSAEMLNRVPPGLYDDLYQTDAATFLRDSQNSFDLIIVANVMPYFRDAAAIINLLARRLNGNGCCALVIDACADRYDVRSTSGGVRNQKADYCHSIRYLTASAAAAGRSVHRCIVSEYRTCPGAYFIL